MVTSFRLFVLSLIMGFYVDAAEAQPAITAKLLTSIVEVTAEVPGDARTVRFLGAKRQGSGYIMSRRDFAAAWEFMLEKAIFTAPPHPPFGGAALIDGESKLIGVGSLMVPNAADDNVAIPGNMFVPINVLKPILRDLLANGRSSRPPRPWLGLYSEELRGRLFVTRVPVGGPAHNAGLRPGDMVLGINDKPVPG